MSLSIAKYKERRQIEAIKTAGLFPESMNTSAKNLVDFIEKYYEHLATVGLPSYEINNITTEKDIDLASSNYLDEIQSLIAKNIPQSTAIDKLTLYKIIFKYYHTRGSEDSIHSFFKIFFNQIVEIYYPKNFLFDLSGGSGQWGDFNPFSLRAISTNPNKKHMRAVSEIEISPKITTIKFYDAKRPLLTHVAGTLWSQNSASPDYNVPYIQRQFIEDLGAYRWVYKYQDLFAQSDDDTEWPDQAKWSTIRRLFVYEEPGVEIDRDINYEETVDIQRDLEFLNTISVEAVPEPGVSINEYVLSLETVSGGEDVDITDLKIYNLIRKNPSVWVEAKLDGKYWSYTDQRSMVSNNYKLQDSYYWQNYSYQIKSPVSSDQWLNSYFKFVHPSGLKLFTSLLLEFFNRNDWDDPIDYSFNDVEENDSYSWLNAYRAPRVGRHIPKFQPGWLTAGDRLFKFLFSALKQKYINVLGTKIIRQDDDRFSLLVTGVYEHDLQVGDKIAIIGSSDERLNSINHTITEVGKNHFVFSVDFDGPTSLESNSVKIIKIRTTPPEGYASYENSLCILLLRMLFTNSNHRESIVHKEYQDWFKFVDSNQLISGYLDKSINKAVDDYDQRGDLKFNNISSFVNLEKNYKILGTGSVKDSSNQFYPWKYSQIIKFEDDDRYFSAMYDSFSESYTDDIFEENQFNYNFSYTPEFIAPIISFTSPIIGEDSFGIIHQNGEDILLENSPHYHPPECINTFEFIHEDENIRVYEDGETKALVK